MDMYQKRKIRQEKNMKKNEGQDVDNKTNINWARWIYGKLAQNIENTHFFV